MKKIILYTFPLLFCISIFCACSDEPEGPDPGSKTSTETVDIKLSDGEWTYFSFSTGNVVGTGTLGSEQDDAAWASRTDWDIALCGDMIRTNSGTSGSGRGGIQQVTDRSYSALTTAPTEGYMVDNAEQIVK